MSGYPRVSGLFLGIMMIILMLKFVQREAICINFNETEIPSHGNSTRTSGTSAVVKGVVAVTERGLVTESVLD